MNSKRKWKKKFNLISTQFIFLRGKSSLRAVTSSWILEVGIGLRYPPFAIWGKLMFACFPFCERQSHSWTEWKQGNIIGRLTAAIAFGAIRLAAYVIAEIFSFSYFFYFVFVFPLDFYSYFFSFSFHSFSFHWNTRWLRALTESFQILIIFRRVGVCACVCCMNEFLWNVYWIKVRNREWLSVHWFPFWINYSMAIKI